MSFPRALPEFVPFYENFPGFDLNGTPSETVRPFFASFPPPTMPEASVASVDTIEIKGGAGQAMNLFVFKPAGATAATPVILAIHGGGGVFGHPLMDTAIYTHYAKAGYSVVSPDYRLAPEAPSPAAGDDVDATWKWILSSATEHNFDLAKTALYGSSFGALCAAGLAIRLQGQAVTPCMTILDSLLADDRVIYPSQAAGHPLAKYHIWSATNAVKCREYNFGDQTDIPVNVSPLRSTSSDDFKGLGPHYILSCELDSLREQGSAYFVALQAAGVEAEFHSYAGAPHAFITLMPESPLSKEAIGEYLRALASKFA